VDLADLLAAASTRAAAVAVVSPTLPGLDADSIALLHRAGLGVVLVAPPEDLDEEQTERWHRLGVEHVLATTRLDALAITVAGASPDVGSPVPDAPAELAEVEDRHATPGQLLVVWGPNGAPGRTTVAVGLATEIAAAGQDVLLVDADAYGGAVAQHLGVLDQASGLLAAARAANSGQLHHERLAGFARRVGDHLRVLTGLPRPDRWPEVRPAAFDTVLAEGGRLATYVVVDVGFSIEPEPFDPYGAEPPRRSSMTLGALQQADEVLVVGAADPVGLSRLARGLVELHEVLPQVRPRVVVNRTRASLGWTDREIRGMVEGFVRPLDVHFLPEDRVAADRALMAGRSLAETGESSLRSAMTALAVEVLGPSATVVGPGRLRRRRAGRAR
jgi:MinD-like ATPase involved in chromosome partitioning or flagellar assembly